MGTKKFSILGKELLSWGDVDRVESKVQRTVKNAVGVSHHGYHTEGLSPEMKRKIALKEPMILKAIHKKNKDTFRNWFEVKTEDDEKPSTRVLNLINKFNKRTIFPYKLYSAGVCANIYGTGFLERTYLDNKSTDSPVKEGTKPLGLPIIDSEHINKREYKSESDKTLYYVYEENLADKKYIHPDRLMVVSIDKLPFSHFGISKIDIAANILKSKMDADVTSGEILSWFSHGILDMTIENMNDEQEKEMLKVFKTHPDYYVHDEDYKLNIVNPVRIDPKPFYDYFLLNIAAAVEMPLHMLTGAQLGDVTGSEVAVSDYYHDVENIQKLIFTPLIEEVYKNLLESHGMSWSYNIDWNPIFVDELSEAKILQTRTFSAVQTKNSGIIDVVEARRILNNGVVDLEVDKIPKQEKEKPVVPGVVDPNIEPQPTVKKPTVKQSFIPLTEEQQKMIDDAVRRERELGEAILREQEELYENERRKIFKRKPKNRDKSKGDSKEDEKVGV